MGYSRSSAGDWGSYSSTTSTKTQKQIFKSSAIDPDMDPNGVRVREARDSELNPESTPIIIACDVTGSMGVIAEAIVKKGLEVLFTEIYDRKPVTDPQILPMAVGDIYTDRAPLQIGQFEADIAAAEWAEKMYLEGNGGGNSQESYDLPYYFAAYHTSHDSFEKRGKKGYIFTIGDEPAPSYTDMNGVAKFIGDGLEKDIPFQDILTQASKTYHCYHIMIAQGFFAQRNKDYVVNSWRKLLNERAIWLEDIDALSETIVSTIQINEGHNKSDVISSWDGSTAVAVANAVKDLGETHYSAGAGGVTTL